MCKEQKRIINDTIKIVESQIKKVSKKICSKETGLALKVVNTELLTAFFKAKYFLEDEKIPFEKKLGLVESLPVLCLEAKRAVAA